MQGFLKQSTAVNVTVLMVDSTDHITGKTGLTLTIYATKAGGTPAAITPTVTELDSTNVKGVYKLALTTSHTDTLGELQLHVTATGADPSDMKLQVVTLLPGEAVTLQADQAVNVTKVNGTSQTARDLGGQLDAAISTRSSHSAADVWAVGTRTLTSFGTLVADIWANATRTLTAISDSAGVTTLLSRISSTLTITGGKVDVNDKTGFSLVTPPLDAAGTRTALGLASANLDTQLGDLPTNAELATALGTADDAVLAAIAALNNLSSAQVQTVIATVLSSGVDADVKKVNGVTLTGNGSTTPWGPA
jgi:hypothetical protein